MTKEEHLKWLQKHLWIDRQIHDVYLFRFILKESDPKNLQYANKNAAYFLKEFTNFSSKELQRINPNVIITPVSDLELLPQATEISQNRISIKYGIIGGMIGGMVGVVFIIGNMLRKKKND